MLTSWIAPPTQRAVVVMTFGSTGTNDINNGGLACGARRRIPRRTPKAQPDARRVTAPVSALDQDLERPVCCIPHAVCTEMCNVLLFQKMNR